MITDINSLRNERELMRAAEKKIGQALELGSPGQVTSEIVTDFANLSSDAQRVAFVAVLATRLSIRTFVSI